MKLLEGKQIAQLKLESLKEQISRYKRAPSVAFILVGNHLASQTYVKMKKKQAALVGISSHIYEMPEMISLKDLLQLISELNQNPYIDGILVQQPLPAHLPTLEIIEAVNPQKDVDGFHPLNLGKLLSSDPTGFTPCTPLGIQHLLNAYHISLSGKHVVIVGRSLIVGKPLAALLSQKNPQANATITLAHAATQNLSDLTRSADVVIAAIGCPLFIKASMIKEQSIIIDVGINRIQNTIVGDVDFEAVAKQASYITPVPGGIGPMTIAMLLANTALAYQRLHQ